MEETKEQKASAEAKPEERIEQKKQKIKNWLKNPYNLALIGILVLAFAIRLYYFFLTKNQALWWDEAEYALKAKSFAFGTPATGWAPERELIVPILFSLFFKAGLGELSVRFIQVLISTLTVFMTYIVGKELFDKKTGLIASLFLSFMWLHIFFTERILLYLWPPLIYLIIIFFFWKGYVKEEKSLYLYLFAISVSIGLQIYFSVGFLILGIIIFLLFTEGFSFLKHKKTWKIIGVFILILLPYAIYSQVVFGFPIPRMAQGASVLSEETGKGLRGIFDYVAILPSRMGWISTIFAGIGILYFLIEIFLRFGMAAKFKDKKIHNLILIFLAFLVPFAIYTYIATVSFQGIYDAFILGSFPLLFILSSVGLLKVSGFAKKYSKVFLVLFILIILGIHITENYIRGDAAITSKISSYDSVKYAGLWIKQNSQPGDIIISRSRPQNTYYSERETLGYPKSEEELDKLIEEKRPKYLIDSIWEQTDMWIHEYPSKHNSTLTPVQAYFLDAEKTQPSLIIYKVNY